MKTKIEFTLTVIILFIIYAFVTNEDAMNALTGKAASAALQNASLSISDDADIYERAKNISDPKVLSTMARHEAQNILQTGDSSRYRQEIKNDPHIKDIVK